MSDPQVPTAPFVVGQEVMPTKELLEHYPMWGPDHNRPAKIASIEPRFNRDTFAGWSISITFPGETSRYLVSQTHLEAGPA
jgi:hypothetical protein